MSIAKAIMPLLIISNTVHATDTDNDTIENSIDNCTEIPNTDQRDTDNDGFGNMCDADFNQDGSTDGFDLGYFRSVYFGSDPDGDFNGDGSVNGFDLGIFKGLFFKPPGPNNKRSATVSWTAPTHNQDGTILTDLAGYFVSYGREVGIYTEVTPLLGLELEYEVNNLTPETWYFVVQAQDFSGNPSIHSNIANKVFYE